MEQALSVFWFLAVAWLILRAVRQREAVPVLTSVDPPPIDAASIAVIVPARNEAENIATCVETVLGQSYPADRFRLYVVDDQSSDRTAAIVASLAQESERVSLLSSPPLPPGWVGKPHACCIGVQAAEPTVAWLCFVDADVRLDSRVLTSAVAAAEAGRFDLLSLAPSQELVSFAERLVLPCGFYLLAFIQQLDRIQAPDSGDAVATGQFMLVRRTAYDAVGGHAAVRNAIIEDKELARLMKRTGFRVAFLSADGLLRVRMYSGWRTLWPGLAKNVVDVMGGPTRTVVTALAGVTLAWLAIVVPVVDIGVLARMPTAMAIAAMTLAAVASCAAFGLHIAGAIYFRIPAWYGCLFPMGYSVGAFIALDGVRRRLIGRIEWKDRTYP